MSKFTACIAYLTFTFFCISAFCVGVAWYVVHHPVCDMLSASSRVAGSPTIVLDDQGKEWARFQYDKRESVSLSVIPHHVINAFIATEDRDFWHHNGLSGRGILRSIAVNFYKGRKEQGASTITQQLVKLLLLDSKKTFKRKIKEQCYALLIEKYYTKHQILEMYLNNVYFGCGIYGVEAAAQRFWNKHVQALTVDQSALLAGIICSPGNYCPLLFPLSAEQRRNVVLATMKRSGFLTDVEYDAAKQCPVAIASSSEFLFATHAQETVRIWLEKNFGKHVLYAGGLIVKTTLNRILQENAQECFSAHFKKIRKNLGGDLDGALITLDSATGAIKAIIGGVDYQAPKFNRAFQARRQQGSVFKPVLYAAALEKGMSLLDKAEDEPLSVNIDGQLWEPRNYTRKFEGSMTLAWALSYSNNIISAKILLEIGVQTIVDYAKKCRLPGPIFAYPSLALGCIDSTLVSVAGMFNIFAQSGVYREPHLIEWVKDGSGKKIYRATPDSGPVFDVKVAQQICQVLEVSLERRRRLAKYWIDSAGICKTGTTNDSRTCWFAGSTPELTTVVYVGADDNRPMGKDVYPAQVAYPLWLDVHRSITTKKKIFNHDPLLEQYWVNWKTGQIVFESNSSDVYPLLL